MVYKQFLQVIAILLLTFLSNSLLAQTNKYTISGYMQDSSTGEKLIGANVFDSKTLSGTTSNTYGFYSMTLPSDSVFLTLSYIGYESKTLKFKLTQDTTITIDFNSAIDLETVVVEAEKSVRIEEETQMSVIDVPIAQIKKIPALFGETDVLKTLQLLPGVQSGGEGQNGLYVRGGSPDQNLILLDGVPVYNVSHVLGIFSVFNADAIKNVKLTKGGFPARYGGRLSSVLEINMKEGNNQEFHGEGSIGLISSKLTLEGPIKKGKTSFLLSGRRTYIDLLAQPIINRTQQDEDVETKIKLFFYDANAKINHKINDKHRLYLSAYSGADVFGNKVTEPDISVDGKLEWGNLISALRWNYQISNKLFANTTLTYSKYDLDVGIELKETEAGQDFTYSARYLSGIQDYAGKIDLDYIPNPNHYIRFGAGVTRHRYSPGAITLMADFELEQLDTLIGNADVFSREYDFYVEDEVQIGKLKANIGLHGSLFDVTEKTYFSLQPRVGLRYLLPKQTSLKASFATMSQFINLLTSEAASLPTDLWVPSTAKIKPQESWQAAIGVAKTFKDKYEISFEAYYKEMKNVISFKEGASFLLDVNNDWQDKVTQGNGESYGAEFFVQKKTGKTTGWIGYTLSWNNRQFDLINGGKKFPFRFDRRHDLSVVVSHDITKNISATIAWVYGTGNAITLPIFKYPVSHSAFQSDQFMFETFSEIETLGEKNAFRLSNYHRLDVSVEFKRKKKRFDAAWVVGLYNAYNHNNPYYIFSDQDFNFDSQTGEVTRTRTFKEVSILPVIPSIAYNFKF